VQSAPRTAPISGLKPFLPKFYGTLALTGQLDGNTVAPVPGAKDLPESIVLENLTYRFAHPSVLDAKLGTVLHAPDASEEKKARMIKKAAETTTGQAGLRLTGASTWHAPTQSFIKTPRGFGYNAKVADLPEGIKRFFPLPDDVLPFLSDEGESGPAYADHALPPRLAARLLAELDAELGRLEGVLSQIELRAVGASVLVVYDGEPARLAAAFERFDRHRVTLAARSLNPETEDSEEDEEEEESSDSDDDGDDGAAADARRARKCPPLVVRLIDFAHTWLEEGEGPDEGVLLGLRTLRGLVQGRRAEVEAWVAAH
jgi:1D-myo-inositol-tetrakisphosphate 5-kinase/inositol-polyphosphate multikinase